MKNLNTLLLTEASFFHRCAANDFLVRDPLAEYQVRNAPYPAPCRQQKISALY